MKGIKVTDSNGIEYYFEIEVPDPRSNARAIGAKMYPNQPYTSTNDQRGLWRYQLHPFTGGLGPNRQETQNTYVNANADVTNGPFITAPPRIGTINLPLANGCTKIVAFNGDIYFLCGRYIYRCDGSYTPTLDRDLGAGVVGTDMAVFNNELIVACGTTGNIQIRDAGGTWTVSSNVQADKITVVNERFWRSLGNNLYSCTTGPGVAANYIQSNNVGDTSYRVNALVEYGGVVWPIKENGAYQADVAEVFKNQTPQLAQWPDARNGIGSFTAKGSLFVPTVNGLLEVNRGISRYVGPENARKPSSNLMVHGGIEWQGTIFLACSDSTGSFVIKMMDVETQSGRGFVYHQYAMLGTMTKPACIGVSTIPTNPTVFIGMESGQDIYYFKLGRGGGRDIDDVNYQYQTTWFIDTGSFQPTDDRTVINIFHGVDIVSSLGSNDSISVELTADGSDIVLLSTDMEYLGETVIRNTKPMGFTRLYAPSGLSGHVFELRMFGDSDPNNAGPIRPEIYEIWAFGYARPLQSDALEMSIIASSMSYYGERRTGMSFDEIVKLWRKWKNSAEILTVETDFTGWGSPFRALVIAVEIMSLGERANPVSSFPVARMNVELLKVDYGRD